MRLVQGYGAVAADALGDDLGSILLTAWLLASGQRAPSAGALAPAEVLAELVVLMVHTPVHAFGLNQVELYFSIIGRKVLTPNDFTDLDVVEQRLTDFEARYNHAAKPFKCKLTTTDLDNLLDRLD